MKTSVNATGRLGQDAVTKTFDNGRSLIEMSIATSNTYKNKDGEKVEETNWIPVKIFVKEINDGFLGLLKKGNAIVVNGTLEFDKWENEGQKMERVFIQAQPSDIQIYPMGKAQA